MDTNLEEDNSRMLKYKNEAKKKHLILINLFFAINKTNKIIYVNNRTNETKKKRVDCVILKIIKKRKYAINWQ